MSVLGIDNLLLAVGDLVQARDFYGRVLGLAEKFAFVDAGIVGYRLGGEHPGLLLRLNPTVARTAPRATPRLWLEVPDTRAMAEVLQARGATPLGPVWQVRTGWVVEVADPWGNVTGFTDYLLDPARGRLTPAQHGREPMTETTVDVRAGR